MATISDLVDRAAGALTALATTAEPLDDEQQYVRDLVTVWSARLRAVGAARPAGVASSDLDAAVAWLDGEARRITDPHRAIDWLSTLPQAVLVALGEDAW